MGMGNHPLRRDERGNILLITVLIILTVGFLGSTLALRAQNDAKTSREKSDALKADHYARELMTEMKEFIYFHEDDMDINDRDLGLIGNNDGFVNILDQYYIYRGIDNRDAPLEDDAPSIRGDLNFPTGDKTHYFYVAPFPIGSLMQENFAPVGGTLSAPYLYDSATYDKYPMYHEGLKEATLEAFIFPEKADLAFQFRFTDIIHSAAPGGTLNPNDVRVTLYVNEVPYVATQSELNTWDFADFPFGTVGEKALGLDFEVDLPTGTPTNTLGMFVIEYRHSLNVVDDDGNVRYSEWEPLEITVDGVDEELQQLVYNDRLGVWKWNLNLRGESVLDFFTREVRAAEREAFQSLYPDEDPEQLSVYRDNAFTLVVRSKSDGGLKTYEQRVNKFTFDDYSFFIEEESLNIAPFSTIFGKIYTGEAFQPSVTARFYNDVIANGSTTVEISDGVPLPPAATAQAFQDMFLKSISQNVPELPFDTVYTFDFIYDEVCDPTGTEGGWRFPNGLNALDFNGFDFAENRYIDPETGTPYTLPRNFNGVVAIQRSSSDGRFPIRGHLHGGEGVTVYCNQNLLIDSHITTGWGGDDSVGREGGQTILYYPQGVTSPRPKKPNVTGDAQDIREISIGLVSDMNIIIAADAPKILRIEAGMFTYEGRVFHADEGDPFNTMTYQANAPGFADVNPPEYHRGGPFTPPQTDIGTEVLIAGDATSATTYDPAGPITPLQTATVDAGGTAGNSSVPNFYRPMHLRMLNEYYNPDGTAERLPNLSAMRKGANYKMLIPDDFWIDYNQNGRRDDVIITSTGSVEGDFYGIWFAPAAAPTITTLDITARHYVYLPIWQGVPASNGSITDLSVYGNDIGDRIVVDYTPKAGDVPALMLDMDNDGVLEPRPRRTDLFGSRRAIARTGYVYNHNEVKSNVAPPGFLEREMEHFIMNANATGGVGTYTNNYVMSYSQSGYNEWAVLPYTYQLQIKGPIISRRAPDFGAYRNELARGRFVFVDDSDTTGIAAMDGFATPPEFNNLPLYTRNAIAGHWSFYGGDSASSANIWINVDGRNDWPVYNNSYGAKTRLFIADNNFGEHPPPFFPRPLKGVEEVSIRETNFQRGIASKVERFVQQDD